MSESKKKNAINVSVAEAEQCTLDVNAVIPKSVYREFVEKSICSISSEKSLPGFRKGKAPKDRIISNFEQEIMKKACDMLVTDIIHKSMEKTGHEIIKHGLKNVKWANVPSISSDKDLELDLSFEYHPKINISPEEISKHFKCESCKDFEVTDKELKEVERSLMAAYFSTMETRVDGIKEEDVVIFNILDKNKKEALEKDVKMMFSVRTMDPEFYNALKGKNAGSKITALLPVSGKNIPIYYKNTKSCDFERNQYDIIIKSAEYAVVPDLTEEIAVTGMGADSMDDLRNKLCKQVQKKKNIERSLFVENAIMDFWFNHYTISIPGSWVSAYIDQLDSQKETSKELTEEKDLSKNKETVKKLAFSIALNDFAEKEGIQIEDKDYMEYINKMLLTGRMTQTQALHLVDMPVEKKYKLRHNILASKAAGVLVDRYLKLI